MFFIGQKVKFQTRTTIWDEGLSGEGFVAERYQDMGCYHYIVRYVYTVDDGPFKGRLVISYVECLEDELEAIDASKGVVELDKETIDTITKALNERQADAFGQLSDKIENIKRQLEGLQLS